MGPISVPPPLNFLVIGAGSRGTAYARAINVATPGRVAAVAEPDVFKRQEFGRMFIWGPDGQPTYGQEFEGWEEWLAWETARRKAATSSDYHPITGILICTLDPTHAPIICGLAPLNLHLFCEKPLALSLSDCLSISTILKNHPPKIFSIGHVLRYSPHNLLLRKLVTTDLAIGEVVSIEHTEPVGWWHFSHSYVRGNWRRETPDGVGSLLSKSCHDIDFLLWLLCSPSTLVGSRPHEPSSVMSVGRLTQFRKARKPKAAGIATNCLSCPLGEEGCIYSAKKIYRDRRLREQRDTGWPLKIVAPDIEDIVKTYGWDAAEERLVQKLGDDWDRATMSDEEIASRSWYGRCVYESDNDVVDDQTVVISWDEDPIAPNMDSLITHNHPIHNKDSAVATQTFGRGPKTALFHMIAPTQALCERRGRIYGTTGEISYDSQTITVYDFTSSTTIAHEIPKQSPEAEESHGGGDFGLIRGFVGAVEAVETGEMGVAEAQRKFVGCDVDEVVRSHGVVFAGEESRRNQGEVVRWAEWWGQ
jgi:predicted dehydrogenase